MRHDVPLAVALLALAVAIGVSALFATPARAQASPGVVCVAIPSDVSGIVVARDAEAWMNEQIALGRIDFVSVGTQVSTICAW